jgi:enoyl-CoA hydratase/carnithine racemase
VACAIRIAPGKGKVRPAGIKLGIIPAGDGTQRMTRLIEEGKAMELMLTGDMNFACGLRALVDGHECEVLQVKPMSPANKIAEMGPVPLSPWCSVKEMDILEEALVARAPNLYEQAGDPKESAGIAIARRAFWIEAYFAASLQLPIRLLELEREPNGDSMVDEIERRRQRAELIL